MIPVPIKCSDLYAEKKEDFNLFARLMKGVGNRISQPMLRRRMSRFPAIVNRSNQDVVDLAESEIPDFCRYMGLKLLESGFDDAVVAKGFALVRHVASRQLGQMHYDVQLMGGWCLLHGMVAEMETGEGKTLTATLPVSIAAMAGIPVHVITANDYLTQRDAEMMRPLYSALGLTVGYVIHGMEHAQRCRAYACDITYCTNKEIAFDYLRDKMVTGNRQGTLRSRVHRLRQQGGQPLLLRGLHFAIVDEADSVLIDEARTPLLIAQDSDDQLDANTIQQSFAIAASLAEGRDFRLVREQSHVRLTDQGKLAISQQAEGLSGNWRNRVFREELVTQALAAHQLYRKNEHYMIVQGKVQIIDAFTGRVMQGRSWGRGIQQMIESKEGCAMTRHKTTHARISYQRFFRRYVHLAGMTGTAKEVRNEFWSVYALPVMHIPTRRMMQRQVWPVRVFANSKKKHAAILERIEQMQAECRPVLVGTRSIDVSEELGRLLVSRGVRHQLLNARQSEFEADIIKQAGEQRCVTIATNMAGRGTDIKLGQGVCERGGLHVIISEGHEARRIDRQLSGRCARQGDPGSYEMMISVDDQLFHHHSGMIGERFWHVIFAFSPGTATWFAIKMAHFLQRRVEREHYKARREVLKMDTRLGDILAFSGRLE